jgi:hypothetical protein
VPPLTPLYRDPAATSRDFEKVALSPKKKS